MNVMTGRTEALHNCHSLADYPDISTSLARDYLKSEKIV